MKFLNKYNKYNIIQYKTLQLTIMRSETLLNLIKNLKDNSSKQLLAVFQVLYYIYDEDRKKIRDINEEDFNELKQMIFNKQLFGWVHFSIFNPIMLTLALQQSSMFKLPISYVNLSSYDIKEKDIQNVLCFITDKWDIIKPNLNKYLAFARLSMNPLINSIFISGFIDVK